MPALSQDKVIVLQAIHMWEHKPLRWWFDHGSREPVVEDHVREIPSRIWPVPLFVVEATVLISEPPKDFEATLSDLIADGLMCREEGTSWTASFCFCWESNDRIMRVEGHPFSLDCDGIVITATLNSQELLCTTYPLEVTDAELRGDQPVVFCPASLSLTPRGQRKACQLQEPADCKSQLNRLPIQAARQLPAINTGPSPEVEIPSDPTPPASVSKQPVPSEPAQKGGKQKRTTKRRERKRRSSHEPDKTGFVKSPSDPTAYCRATKIIKEYPRIARDYKTLHRILDRNPTIKRTKPRKYRLSIHFADWCRFAQSFKTPSIQSSMKKEDDWDDDPPGVEQRTEEIRNRKNEQ